MPFRALTIALLVSLLISLCGCSALKDKAADYLSEAAVDQITRAVDRKLEDRGLSVAQFREIADENNDKQVTPGEVASVVKATTMDYISIQMEHAAESAKRDLEPKFAALASVRDLDGLKEAAEKNNLWSTGTAGSVVLLLISALVNRVFSANKHAKTREELAVTNARLGFMEKLLGRDLNNDGIIGAPPNGNGGGNGEGPATT